MTNSRRPERVSVTPGVVIRLTVVCATTRPPVTSATVLTRGSVMPATLPGNADHIACPRAPGGSPHVPYLSVVSTGPAR
jgi:hypothetical protein